MSLKKGLMYSVLGIIAAFIIWKLIVVFIYSLMLAIVAVVVILLGVAAAELWKVFKK